ncbi:MAG: hypothetical protein JEY79_03480 [Pseudodesulfovibrio sp.]|nr:hypothetical protein [Pseudodesulfovibrio sp.]
MKKKISLAAGLCFVGLLIFFFNTNYFAAFFLSNKFYSPIYTSEFDALTIGTTVSIPLKFKYKTEYGFSLSVPTKGNYAMPVLSLDGHFQYRFIIGNTTLKEGSFSPMVKTVTGLRNNLFLFDLFYFDLPFEDISETVTLEVKIISPVTKLEKYKGTISCFIAPTYSPDRGGARKNRLGIYF